MSGNFSTNKLLRYYFPVLFLIPLNFFIISGGMGSGIQWFFVKYQTTFVGDSAIPIASSVNYVLSGIITGKSALYEVSPLFSLVVLFIAFMYAMTNRTKIAGVLTMLSGILSLSAAVLQYGITLHGPAGMYIPFGSVILLVYGLVLYLTVPDPGDENPLIRYDYLFLILGVFFVFCNWPTPFMVNDTIGTEALPFSILENHTVYLDETYQSYSYDRNYRYRFIAIGGDHYASLFPVVTPVMVIPLYAIPFLFNIPDTNLLHLVMSHVASALIAALSVMFIYLACRYISGRKIALLSALVFAFATSTWSISSQQLYAHGMSELLLAAMIFLVLRNESDKSTGNIVFLGVCSGLFVFNRPSDSILVLPIVGYVLWYHRENIGHFFVSAIISGFPFLMYNLVLFNNIFGGYSKVTQRLTFEMLTLLSHSLGLLIAPNRGLFVFTPILIFAVLGFWVIKNKNRPACRFLLGSIPAMAVTILVYASFDDWQGGETYGPRYLTCLLPYLIIGLCIFFNDLAKKPRNKIIIAVVVIMIVISVFIQFIGVMYYRPSSNPQVYFPNEFCSYDAWDTTDLVIINSLYHLSARKVIRNDNGDWLRKIIEKGG